MQEFAVDPWHWEFSLTPYGWFPAAIPLLGILPAGQPPLCQPHRPFT
jgi:hypothetical protein